MELVRVIGDRPAVIKKYNGWIYVSIHDTEHLRVRDAFQKRILRFHPDRTRRTGQAQAFKDAVGAYREFLREEWRWYQEYKVSPPKPITAADLWIGLPKKHLLLKDDIPVPPALAHCEVCGNSFQPRRRRKPQRLCSHKCVRTYARAILAQKIGGGSSWGGATAKAVQGSDPVAATTLR
jgi:hypothetical protein